MTNRLDGEVAIVTGGGVPAQQFLAEHDAAALAERDIDAIRYTPQ